MGTRHHSETYVQVNLGSNLFISIMDMVPSEQGSLRYYCKQFVCLLNGCFFFYLRPVHTWQVWTQPNQNIPRRNCLKPPSGSLPSAIMVQWKMESLEEEYKTRPLPVIKMELFHPNKNGFKNTKTRVEVGWFHPEISGHLLAPLLKNWFSAAHLVCKWLVHPLDQPKYPSGN